MNARGFRSMTVTLLLLGTSIVILAAASVTAGTSATPATRVLDNKLATIGR